MAMRSVAFSIRDIMKGLSKTAFGIFRLRAKNKNVGFAPQVSLLRAI
jgi:hypothetical protein